MPFFANRYGAAIMLLSKVLERLNYLTGFIKYWLYQKGIFKTGEK